MSETTNIKREFKGVWIPKDVWLAKDLSLIEKVFLIEIDSLDGKDGCYASNQYFAEFFSISKTRCSQIINSLKSKKYIDVEIIKEGKEIKKRVIRVLNILKRGGKYSKEVYLENCKENNTSINNIRNNKKDPLEEAKEIAQDLNINLNTEAYKEWIEYRRESKKSLTVSSIKKQVKLLCKYDLQTQQKMIDNSIANSYQGIFELKVQQSNTKDYKSNNLPNGNWV
jgi:hypothetical protein